MYGLEGPHRYSHRLQPSGEARETCISKRAALLEYIIASIQDFYGHVMEGIPKQPVRFRAYVMNVQMLSQYTETKV